MGREIINPDGQSRGAALIRGFGYCLSLLSTWFHMSKVGVRLLSQVRLQTQNLRYSCLSCKREKIGGHSTSSGIAHILGCVKKLPKFSVIATF